METLLDTNDTKNRAGTIFPWPSNKEMACRKHSVIFTTKVYEA